MAAALIVLVAMAGLLAGAISLISPLQFLNIHDRKTAGLIICGSMMLYLPASAHLSSSPIDALLSVSATTAIPVQVATARPANLDGCDLAGAIPDCKQEVARLAAVQATHPLPPLPVVADAPKDRGPDKFLQDLTADIEADRNARIADEARANLAAHDIQRRLDEADAEVARNRLTNARRIADNNAAAQLRRMAAERAQYGARVQQRIWEQRRRDLQR